MLGGASIWSAIYNITNGWASEDWPSVEGLITTAELHSSTQSSGSSVSSSSSTTHYPVITYQYDVDGTPHEGYEIVFGGYSFSDKSDAQKVLDKYAVNQNVRVYYHPEKHRTAVLEPGLLEFPFGFLFGGILFVGVGLLLIKFFPKS